MYFTNEFELEVNGNEYFIEVEGEQFEEDDQLFHSISSITIKDSVGNLVESDHPDYFDIKQEVNNREFDLEVHESDFEREDTGEIYDYNREKGVFE